MSQPGVVAQTFNTSSASPARRKLFKADHPRAIDWYIDYFGGRPPADVSVANDPCGESLLDALGLYSIRPIAPQELSAENSIGTRMALKALRGLENITWGFVTEWPKTIYYDSVDHEIAYGITVGALRGAGLGVLRTGIGVYEAATFPVPLPKNYKPMLYPEFAHELRERTR